MNATWFAIRLFTLRQNDVANYFKEQGLEVFIPMEHADIEDDNHKVHHILRPVVRNLIFVKNRSFSSKYLIIFSYFSFSEIGIGGWSKFLFFEYIFWSSCFF